MKVSATLFMLLACQIAAADLAATPVFGELVAFRLPAGFAPVYEKADGKTHLQESVRTGESVEQWSQMVSLTGSKDQALNPAATPAGFADKLASGFHNACPETFSIAEAGRMKVGGHDAYVALLGCGSVQTGTPRSEIAMIIAIKGKTDMYTIQWAERSSPTTRAPTLDGTLWAQRFQLLGPINLCDRVPGENAPFPSCIGEAGAQ